MRISSISDVHVKAPFDAADKLLLKFLNHPTVLESDYILLLGDIFDLMCGAHRQYLKDYSHIFSKMDEYIQRGKKLYFIEGNHDVHLNKLFSLYWAKGELTPYQNPIIEEINGKKYYFSHGDEHDVSNQSYHRYKNFIMSPPLKFVADYIMPYSVLNFLGEKASVISRKKGSRKFDEEKVRLKFRKGTELTIGNKNFDFAIGGHSHVKDNYLMSNGRTIYLNNGYALKSKSFITINDHEVSFIDLT